MTDDRKNPNLRPFLTELERIVDDLKHRLPCCPNCAYWRKQGEVCGYQGQMIKPPADVIAFGCWAFDMDIPF